MVCTIKGARAHFIRAPPINFANMCMRIGDADEDQTIIAELSSTNLSDEHEAETGDFTTTTPA